VMLWEAYQETGPRSGTEDLDKFELGLWSTALAAYQADYKELERCGVGLRMRTG
jgi:hypothetical protein